MSKNKPVSRRRPAGPRVAVVAAAAVVVLTGLVWVFRNPMTAPERTPLAQDPGVAHVHGLEMDPGDEELYAATHTGLFRIPRQGRAERVGGSYQDTMGFTIAGPDRFLGSGHPDVPSMRRGQPPLLGLIESTDAGETWEQLSLSGEADFHSMAFAHGRVYGWNSTAGSFMVSNDLSTWETRSSVDLLGFAVDPTDAEHIVGTGPNGLFESTDGGRTWEPADGPGLVVLSWDPDMGLWGVEPDGTVHRRATEGPTWQPAGPLPGEPEALLARDGVLYAAARDGQGTGIYRSGDEGATWRLVYRDET